MKVFLSHAHEDTDLARRIGDALEEAGLEVWDAGREVLPGDNLALEVGRALQASDVDLRSGFDMGCRALLRIWGAGYRS